MNRHSAVSGRSAARASAGEKRARILDAAVRVFAEKGFYNAKVSEIARLADVADGTIYLYFKSKDDLLIRLFEDRMDEVIENGRAALAGDGTPVEKLRRLVMAHLALVQDHPQLAEVLTVELRQSSKFLKEYKPSQFGELLKLIAAPIEEGQRDGTIRREVDPPIAARAIFGALDELVLAWVLDPQNAFGAGKKGARAAAKARTGAVDLARTGEQLCTFIIDGLRAPSGRPDKPDEPDRPADDPGGAAPEPPQPMSKRRAS